MVLWIHLYGLGYFLIGDKLSIVLTEFTNIFGDSDVRWGITATTKIKSARRQMKLVLRRREIYPRTNGILRKNIPAFLNLSGYSFLRERCMGQWMSREMPDGGVCKALSRPARHETRCARHCQADGWGTGLSRKCPAVTRGSHGFRSEMQLSVEGRSHARTDSDKHIPTRWLRFTSNALFIVQDISSKQLTRWRLTLINDTDK